MNKQRKVLITTTYNEMGIIIDTKAEEVPPMSDSTEVTPRWPKTYLCDPRKNVRCPKGITCFMNGGPCQETTREEYATDPETQAALMGYIITEVK